MRFEATQKERDERDEVVERVLRFIRENRTIKLPPFTGGAAKPGGLFAMQAMEPNEFSGVVSDYRYQFEGEDDLLHIAVMRRDAAELAVEDARHVLAFLLPEAPPGLIWLRPGSYSQHFYVGHDVLV